ncbi:MAG: AraC family transcriptional regulator [Flavobacteriales bacterium]|nr:AraC family transcriptional regulator [Flavobacteriales bacterium]
MVSRRCKLLVEDELKRVGIYGAKVDLGVVDLIFPLSKVQHDALQKRLHDVGLELLDDKKSILVEQIKKLVIEMVHYTEDVPIVNNSDFMAERLGYNYTYLSNLFSEVKGITIQHFYILHKIERAKEFLIYNDFSLTEIAFRLNYSSVAHLSNQFKKITGLTPTFFKHLKDPQRSLLEDF